MFRFGKSEEDWEELYRTQGPRVRRTLTSMVRNASVAEELTQEAFLKAWKSLSTFGFRSSLKTWVFQIAINTAKDWIRAHRNFEQLADEDYYEDFSPETKAIEEALEKLDVEVRSLLILHYYEGMELAELSDVLKVPLGTVKSRLHSAKQKLRPILVSKGFDV